ncbi:MAG: hypothetical protein ABII71_03305 [Candidatus Micrarchaeota archaeon]
MVDIRDVKIRKKTYHFDVKRRYQNVKHYLVHKKGAMDKLKDGLKGAFSPKPKEEPKKKGIGTTAPPPSGFNLKILGAAIMVALLIIGLGWMYISTAFLNFRPGVFEPQLEKPVMANWITGGDVLTAGERSYGEHSALIYADLSSSSVEWYAVNITTYKERLPSEVFILKAHVEEGSTYPTFLRELRTILSRKQITLNEITLEQLKTIPGSAMVIVPTGVVPQELLGVGSETSFKDLIDRGVVFVYMGQPFWKMYNGQFIVSTPQYVLDALPVTFNEDVNLFSSDKFHLFQPTYQATPKGGGLSGQMLFGSVSVLKSSSGAFIFIPQTLDGGWRGDAALAAADISMFVFDYPWLSPNSNEKEYQFNITRDYSNSIILFTNPFEGTGCSVKAEFTGYSSTSKYPLEGVLIARVEKEADGELYIEGGYTVVPTNITNTRIRMNARLDEPEPAQPNMYLVMTNNERMEVARIPQGTVNVQSDTNFDVPIYLEQGEYIVSLVDDGSHTYAESYMEVVSIEIARASQRGLGSSQYAFEFTMGRQPVMLEDVVVEIDGGRLGTYEYHDVSSVVVDISKYTGGDQLPLGNHTFEFTAGGLKKTIAIERKIPPSPLTDPLFLLVIFLAGGIAVVGMYFARQETVYYSLDIPDFPPIARTKVPLSTDVVLSVFEKVNEGYKWKNVPLTTSEIRNGFSNIFYQGRPIYITDYNVEYLLDELIKEKKVGQFLDYYCPLSWEGRAKKSVQYLAMMRKLRDICVNNAVPFTGLNESNVADSEIEVVGQQMYVHFYDKSRNREELFSNVLSTVGKGISIILFRNEAEKHDFSMLLNSPFNAPLVVKMETEGSSAQLQTIPEFNKMLVELKSV